MEAGDAFLTLAEFSIALAGFTSVVVVFAHRSGEEFSSIDRFRIQGALWASLGPAILAFAPIAFDLFGLSGMGVWRASSGLFCFYLLMNLGVQLPRLTSLSDADRAVLGSRIQMALVSGGTLANLVLQPLNVLGVLFPPHPGVFFVGLLLMLLTSIIIFVRIVFIRPSE